jgi:hypothetical protein
METLLLYIAVTAYATVLILVAIDVFKDIKKLRYGTHKHKNPPTPPLKFRPLVMSEADRMHLEADRYTAAQIAMFYGLSPDKLSSYPGATFNPLSLEMQLQQAIESEKYEEAARIRDLINQSKAHGHKEKLG